MYIRMLSDTLPFLWEVLFQRKETGPPGPASLGFQNEMVGFREKKGYTTSPEPAPSLASDHAFSNSDQSRLGRSLVQIS